MSTPKVYALCGTNCRYETLTKEQIITAIANAVQNGDIGDIDAGFITTLKEQNAGEGLRFWVGTMAAYNALTEIADDMLYIITDDTTNDDIDNAINEIQDALDNIFNGISTVPKANRAKQADYASYASSDTSKGTIEERLTNLGFRQGSASVSLGSAAANKITRQGNYCILNLTLTSESVSISGSVATLPDNFKPKAAVTTKVVAKYQSFGYARADCTISTSGAIEITPYYGASYPLLELCLENIGYEANPIK